MSELLQLLALREIAEIVLYRQISPFSEFRLSQIWIKPRTTARKTNNFYFTSNQVEPFMEPSSESDFAAPRLRTNSNNSFTTRLAKK